MPCIFCEDEYIVIPCKSNDGILNRDNLKVSGFISSSFFDDQTTPDLIDNLSLLFKRQHEHCPCIKCLVKMMCITTVECEIYNRFLHMIYREETFGIKGEY